MIKHLKFAALCLVFAAGPAVSGEIGGSGRVTPIEGRGVASSICAYSGLNDEYVNSGIGSHVQTYGAIVAAFGGIPPFVPSPGAACRG
jgi:hypothetical protein